MHVDDLAHAVSVVFCRSALSDFDLTPGSMHVEEDEQVGRSIALILAVETFELAWSGRDRLAHLADELCRTLVETNHRALRIGLFSIEVEHVLHAGDILGVDLRNAPHVLAPWFQRAWTGASRSRMGWSWSWTDGEGAWKSARFKRPRRARRSDTARTSKVGRLPSLRERTLADRDNVKTCWNNFERRQGACPDAWRGQLKELYKSLRQLVVFPLKRFVQDLVGSRIE